MDVDAANFTQLDLSPRVLGALDSLGFETPTPIQAKALPHGLAGRDVIGQAQTGTGKTLAFGLPLVESMDATRRAAQALVLCPTRELAQQVAEALEPVARARELQVVLLVGGEKIRLQRPRIPGSQIVVGTPGRVLDLLRESLLHLEWVSFLVLDEFDRMLDMGFIDEVSSIVRFLPAERQTMLFSATIPPGILRPALGFVNEDAVTVRVSTGLRVPDNLDQSALRISADDRLEIFIRLLQRDLSEDADRTVLVFANTRRMVAELDRELWGRDLPAAAISGDFDQTRRFQVIEGFRQGRIRILVATDVASRGLDIDHVGHVINFDVPLEAEDYVHRIGRTARAGRSGRVTTLVIPQQARAFGRILKDMKVGIKVGRAALRSPARARGPGRGRDREEWRGPSPARRRR
jgi:ATP-dependent RNA helicase DeaD